MQGILVYFAYMPRASKRFLNKNVHRELQDHFAYLISSLQKSEDIERFFDEFLTREEKLMLSKRLMLHMMLENDYSISHIERVLKMSRETIRYHKHIWEKGGSIYRNIISKIVKRQKTKEFWKKVEEALKPVDLLMKSKTNMKARAKFASGDWYD